MNEINACFVSYRHPHDRGAQEYLGTFVEQLKTQLARQLPGVPIYFDAGGMAAGTEVDPQLARELCRSACMLMLYCTLHFSEEYPHCAREYRGMLDLEERHRARLRDYIATKRLVIPVVMQGRRHLPDELDRLAPECFEEINHPAEFRRQALQPRIRRIADEVAERYLTLMRAGAFGDLACEAFTLPTVADVLPMIKLFSVRETLPGRSPT